MISWKYTHPLAIQDVDEFVSSSEQIWRNVALHHLLIKTSQNSGDSLVYFTCKWDSIVLQQIMVHYFVSLVDFLTQNLAVISTFHAWYEISVNLSWRPDIIVSELCCCFDARQRLVTLCWITSSRIIMKRTLFEILDVLKQMMWL